MSQEENIKTLEYYTLAFINTHGNIETFVNYGSLDGRRRRHHIFKRPIVQFGKEDFSKIKKKIKKYGNRRTKQGTFNVGIVKITYKVDTNMLYDGNGGSITKFTGDRVYITNADKTKIGKKYLYNQDDGFVIDYKEEVFYTDGN